MTLGWWNTSSFDLLQQCTFSNTNLSQIFETLTERASSDLSRETISQLVLPSEEEVVIDLSMSCSLSDMEPIECKLGSSYGMMPDMNRPKTNISQSPSCPISSFDPKSQMTAHHENITSDRQVKTYPFQKFLRNLNCLPSFSNQIPTRLRYKNYPIRTVWTILNILIKYLPLRYSRQRKPLLRN